MTVLPSCHWVRPQQELITPPAALAGGGTAYPSIQNAVAEIDTVLELIIGCRDPDSELAGGRKPAETLSRGVKHRGSFWSGGTLVIAEAAHPWPPNESHRTRSRVRPT